MMEMTALIRGEIPRMPGDRSDGKQRCFSRVTDMGITQQNAEAIMQTGRDCRIVEYEIYDA